MSVKAAQKRFEHFLNLILATTTEVLRSGIPHILTSKVLSHQDRGFSAAIRACYNDRIRKIRQMNMTYSLEVFDHDL